MDDSKAAEDATQKDTAHAHRTRKGRAGASQTATKDVVVQSVDGPVNVVDNSVNVVGDGSSATVHATVASRERAGELLGQVNLAVEEVYRALKRNLPLDELGRVALECHEAVLSSCRHEDEFPHALAIMKLRLHRKLGGGTTGAAGSAS